MYNCIICTQETDFSSKCDCHFCLFCLLNWFDEKNRDKPVEILQCPNQGCNFTYNRNEILSFCSLQPYEKMIQEILLKEYLKNQDIRPCPNGKCKYFGYIELDNKCDDELECFECGMKWRDFALASYTFQTEYMIKNIFGIIREFCYCFITTNECPNCGILIQRNGGCKHITCKACAHQFCWYCKQQWGRHKESQCFSSEAISIGLLLTFPINILHQFGIFSYFLYVFYPLLLLLELLIMNVLVIGTGYGTFILVKSIIDLKNNRRGFCSNLLAFGGSILLLIIEYFIFWFSSVFLDITFQKAFIGILIELSIAILFIGYLNRVSLRWILIPLLAIFLFYFFGFNGFIMLIWQIPVLTGSRNFLSQVGFNALAIGLLILFNIFSLLELFSSILIYLILGSTYFQYKTNYNKSNLVFVGIVALSYLYELIFA
ncbi:unnamed protein product [Paramecium pentaurelia]|uniref:RING-type domain-containing protein n=1 Tax=Paramecium pentaurelia TaxID=43138 RepID=A0A8S1XRJ0_9CILI|nr:unnamed protein product [Paramecium pentaurelia]